MGLFMVFEGLASEIYKYEQLDHCYEKGIDCSWSHFNDILPWEC